MSDEFILIDDIGDLSQIQDIPVPIPQGPPKPKQRLHDLVTLFSSDCLEVMGQLADNCIDAVVTDPPYELGFMGKAWDKSGIAFQVSLWAEVFRVLKPGGHALVMGGTRTYHRLVCAIEDAGFEIRDTLMWVYGQGFPKSQNVSKAIDKAAGVEQKVIGLKIGLPGYSLKANDTDGHDRNAYSKYTDAEAECSITVPATPEAKQWDGWGTALKPAHEMICLARKPLSEKTVAANVLMWGTGALNIDGCCVVNTDERASKGYMHNASADYQPGVGKDNSEGNRLSLYKSNGRWPANLIHDGSAEVVEVFPVTKSGNLKGETVTARFFSTCPYTDEDDIPIKQWLLYCAKASKQERNGSKHPTIKPIKLMQWLCRLITPPDGCILDPFAGSGTTGAAAVQEGFQAILCENDPESQSDIRRRFTEVLTIEC